MYGPGGRGLDRSEDRVVDVHELAQLRKVLADQREVVLVVELTDRADALEGILVAELGAESETGVGRIGDEPAVLDHGCRLVDGSLLRVVGVDLDEARHRHERTTNARIRT